MGDAVLFEQLLPRELGLGVGRFWLRRHRLELRRGRVIAINGGGGSQDDLAGARGQGGIQHSAGALGVQLGALSRLGDRLWYGDHCGEMIDLLGASDRLFEGDVIQDGPWEKTATDTLEVPGIAAAQVIEHRDFSLLGEMTCQV